MGRTVTNSRHLISALPGRPPNKMTEVWRRTPDARSATVVGDQHIRFIFGPTIEKLEDNEGEAKPNGVLLRNLGWYDQMW